MSRWCHGGGAAQRLAVGAALFLATITGVAVHGIAAQQPTFSSRVEAVRVDVLVTDKARAVRGLRASDFELLDNGVRQTVDLVVTDQRLNVVLALDMSNSVAGARLDDLREACRSILDRLRVGDRAGLVTFSHLVVLASDLTEDRDQVRTVVNGLVGRGDTALVDGAYAGIILGDEDAGRTLLVIFSDGVDTSSWLTADAVLGVAKRSDIVAYAVSAGTPASPFLRDLASATGGSAIDLETTKTLSSTFLDILEEFRGRYVISFTPRGVPTEGWHSLTVRVKGRNVAVKARPGYSKESGMPRE